MSLKQWEIKIKPRIKLNHNISILSSINLCGTFCQITRVPNTAQTWHLDRCLNYLSSIPCQFLDFIHGMVSIFFSMAWQWKPRIGWLCTEPFNYRQQNSQLMVVWNVSHLLPLTCAPLWVRGRRQLTFQTKLMAHLKRMYPFMYAVYIIHYFFFGHAFKFKDFFYTVLPFIHERVIT